MMHAKLSSRIIGFVSSLFLTLLAFALIAHPFDIDTTVLLLLLLAVLQSLAQAIFFLNILDEKGPRWNLIVFASTLSIILIIVIGAIWIMGHLDDYMSLSFVD